MGIWGYYSPADLGIDPEDCIKHFTGRCAKCGGFLSEKPGESREYVCAWVQSSPHYEAVLRPATDRQMDLYHALRLGEQCAVQAGDPRAADTIRKERRRRFHVEYGEPAWPCTKCNHHNTDTEVWT